MKETLDILNKIRTNCPCDIDRGFDNIFECLEEEIEEVKEAIKNKDMENLKEELGDVLWDSLFLVRIAEDTYGIKLDDVLKNIKKKMKFRHPHVFEEKRRVSIEEARKIWIERKALEKTK